MDNRIETILLLVNIFDVCGDVVSCDIGLIPSQNMSFKISKLMRLRLLSLGYWKELPFTNKVLFQISLSGMGKVVLYGWLTRMLNMVIDLLLKETLGEH